jgi:hypothetical protein
MKDYNVVEIPTDFTIVKENFYKLNFINDVAIFYDKTRTSRMVFNKHSNFNVWLEDYCKSTEIDFWKLRALLKPLVESVKSDLLSNFHDRKLFEISTVIKESILGLLLNNESIYNDLMRAIWHHLPIENNYTLISSDGQYLMSKNYMIVPCYFNNIEINEYGLFKCEVRGYSFQCGKYNFEISDYDLDYLKTTRSIYYWDSHGHFLDEYEFEKFNKIIKNIKVDNYSLLKELNDSIFKVVGPKHNVWRLNEGKEHIKWNVQREDGLLFYSEEYSSPGSDTYTDFEYVRDSYGNSMYVNDFYSGLKCLHNGSAYLNQLKVEFLKKETSKFI